MNMNYSNINPKTKTFSTQKIVILALMCAVAYVLTVLIRVPVVSFLTYDPKDIIIVLAGFIFSPIYSVIVSLVVSLIEMVTVSNSGPIGLIMNVMAGCTFALTASIFYKKSKSNKSVVFGFIVASISMTVFMLAWNYLITPFYLGTPREAVVDMLVPIILPFNLIKSALNSCIILLIYKPIINSLRNNKLIDLNKQSKDNNSTNIPIMIISAFIIVTCIFIILVLNKVI